MLAVAFMMISTIPTFSGKKVGARVPRDKVIPISIAVVLLIAALVSFPFPILAITTLIYLACIPVGWRLWHRQNRAWQAAEAEIARTTDAAGATADPPPRS